MHLATTRLFAQASCLACELVTPPMLPKVATTRSWNERINDIIENFNHGGICKQIADEKMKSDSWLTLIYFTWCVHSVAQSSQQPR